MLAGMVLFELLFDTVASRVVSVVWMCISSSGHHLLAHILAQCVCVWGGGGVTMNLHHSSFVLLALICSSYE